jgi:hypothetical protein
MVRHEAVKISQRTKTYFGFDNHGRFLSNFMFWTTALILILIAGLRPIGLDRDSITYVEMIQSYTDVNLLALEPAFWIIKWFNDNFFSGNVHTFFLIYAILGVFIKFLAIKRLSKLPWLSVGTYLSLYFILHEMAQIRAGVAAGFFYCQFQIFTTETLKNLF